MLQQALRREYLKAGWVAADDAFGMSPFFRDGLAALGMCYVLDVPGLYGVAGGAGVDQSGLSGVGLPPSPNWWADSGAPWGSRTPNCRRRLGRK